MKKKAVTKLLDFFASDWSVFFGYLFLVIIVYVRTLGVGFFSDDYHMLSVFSSGISPLKYFFSNIVGELGGGSYGPLFAIFHYGEFKIFGLNAVPYHIVALVLHSVNAFLVYFLAKRLSGRRDVSILSGLIFALAAHQVSAVIWIAVLPHLLATLFALLSVIMFVRYLQGVNRVSYGLSILFYGLSLCAKENALFLPVVLGVLFLFENELVFRKKILSFVVHVIPFIVFAGLFFLARSVITGATVGFYAHTSIGFDLAHYRSMFFDLLSDFFTDYPLRVVWHDQLFKHWVVGLIFFISPLLAVLAWWREKRQVSIVFFFAFIFGIIPFLPLLLSYWDDGAERYTYFSSAFFWPYFFLGGAALLRCFGDLWQDKIFARRLGFCLLGGVLIINLLAIYHKQNRWIDSGKIVRAMIVSAQNLDLGDKYTVFVGLPDNLSGAELSRNAIIETLELETGVVVRGERIPLYTAPRVGKAFLYRAGKDVSNKALEIVSGNAGRTDFTGFKEYSRPFADFILGGYVKPDMGAKIVIKPKNNVYWYDGHYLPVVYVFFDGQKLVEISEN